MSKLKLNLTRRWVRARPGSVLILVIALLVLLALIGTAYLSSTQTERYSSVQNSINTEADLLINGLQNEVNSEISAGLYSEGSYRPPQQEMPTYPIPTAAPYPWALNGYSNYDSILGDPNLQTNASPLPSDPAPTDLYLASRIPSYSTTLGTPIWDTISWPLQTDSSGNYTFDSPFDNSITTYIGQNKGKISAIPTARNINGQWYPALAFTLTPNTNAPVNSSGTPVAISPGPIIAASASGDGIADAALVKLPIGPIDGITYYYATRIVDGNSAINASTANTQGLDTGPYAGMATTNYGFFRANIGLQELLTNTGEMSALSTYRFPATPPAASYSFYSEDAATDDLLARMPGTTAYNWLGQSSTAALAYKYSLCNPSTISSPNALESLLSTELLNSPIAPWSAVQVGNNAISGSWYYNNFNLLNTYSGAGGGPLRTVLVGNNAVSNAVPARLGNASSGPPVWTSAAGTVYSFGDWVLDGPTNGPYRSFVCIRQHTPVFGTNEPENGTATDPGYNPVAAGYWAGAQPGPAPAYPPLPGMPFTSVPVKTSINTATFEQLWVGFAQVMTDSLGLDVVPAGDTTAAMGAGTQTKQWQPPMQPTAVLAGQEQQMPMFRSTIRSSSAVGAGKLILTSSQMLKLRAALAAVNTIDLRDYDDNVSSREIVLTDDTGTPQYDVEVYGSEKEPYIAEVFMRFDGKSADAYVAVELCNPYPTPIYLTDWQIGKLNRMISTLALGPGLAIPADTYIPAATVDGTAATAPNGVPGMLILEDNKANRHSLMPDQDALINARIAVNPTKFLAMDLIGLASYAVDSTTNQPNEVFLMRPRVASTAGAAGGTLSSSAAPNNDLYNESDPIGDLSDYVPVDQIDLTGLTVPALAAGGSPPERFLYRRGTDGPNGYGWHFVYPGFYDPASAAGPGRYFNDKSEAAAAIVADTTDKADCNLGAVTGAYPVAPLPLVASNSTYTTMPIELNNLYMGGPSKLGGATTVFPFGGFARNGDMMQIPFIGAYRIRPWAERGTIGVVAQTLTELNSVTIDSALANDTTLPTTVAPSLTNGATATPGAFNEQIGRFCPVGDPSVVTSPASTLMDFGPGFLKGDATELKQYWHYHWAKKLFDYFTVQSPQDDYAPNVDPVSAANVAITPVPIANSNSNYKNAQTAGHSEDTTGVEGLVNINNAPMAVLAQLPFTGATTPSPAVNVQIAQAIVAYRTTYGPFQSIVDLCRVPLFLNQNSTLLASASAPGPAQGVFSPGGIGTAASAAPPAGTVRYDFQERFLLLNNISNLITTRSDTFTCYVLLQGWRNVGTGNPTLVVQRRAAFLVDRNGVTPSNNQPSSYKFPSQ